MNGDPKAVDRVCRICLKKGHIPIYGKNPNEDFSFDVRTFGDIELTEDDHYPKHLCTSCHALLQSAKLFRKTAKASADILKKYDSEIDSDEDIFSDDIGWDSDDNAVDKVSSEALDNVRTSKELLETLEDVSASKDIENVNCDGSVLDKFNFDVTVENLSCAIDPSDIIDSKDFDCETKANTSKPNVKNYKRPTAYLLENHFTEVSFNKEDSFKCRLKYSKYQCNVCDKIITKQYCKEHFALHDPNVPKHTCNICGKNFVLKEALLNHRFIHSTEFKFRCKLCPYKGRSSTYLKTHMKTHMKEYRFFCDECPAKFLTKSNYNRHLERHKEPTYNCEACDKSFRWKCRLKHHYDTEHLGLRSHICTQCGKGFSYRKDLRRHEMRMHKNKKKSTGKSSSMAEDEEESEKE